MPSYPGGVLFLALQTPAACIFHNNVVTSVAVGCVLKNLLFDLRNSSLGNFLVIRLPKKRVMMGRKERTLASGVGFE